MEALRAALDAADEAYLTAMANKGIYKRAVKDIDGAEITADYENGAAQVHLGGEICRITVPLWESRCSCPSRSACRHMIGAILWLRANLDAEPEKDEPEEMPEEAPEDLSPELAEVLRSVTPAMLRRVLGKHLRNAAEAVKEGRIILEESGSVLSSVLSDGTAVQLRCPLEYSSCTCRKKKLCPHKAAVILAWQAGEGLLEPDALLAHAGQLPPKEQERIRAHAAACSELLGDVLRWGLVRIPENLPSHMEIAAVRCHSLQMAEGERRIREIGSRLMDYRERRAVFRPLTLLRQLCDCAVEMTALQKPQLYEEDLGTFRRTYEAWDGALDLLPIGQRRLSGGDYEGDIFYFLNMDEDAQQRFLSFSDVRLVFYEGTAKRRRQEHAVPWNLGAPMSTMMRSRMVVHNARICEGRLSASQETCVAMRSTANLDCDAIRHLLYQDFTKLARDFAGRDSGKELERLCFVHPKACTACGFDPYTQQYRMLLLDRNGCRVAVEAAYSAREKNWIDLLEQTGAAMTAHPEKDYVFLALVRFEKGELKLFPIEVYDFIRVPEPEERQLSEEERTAQRHGPQAVRLMELFGQTEEYLCSVLQCGLQSADSEPAAALVKQAGAAGLTGFAGELEALAAAVEQFRHTLEPDCGAALRHLTALHQYQRLAETQLALPCALYHMKGINEHDVSQE